MDLWAEVGRFFVLFRRAFHIKRKNASRFEEVLRDKLTRGTGEGRRASETHSSGAVLEFLTFIVHNHLRLNALKTLKNDFSVSAFVAGLIVLIVGMTSSAVIVFQAAQAFGADLRSAGSWLGSLCIGMGLLTLYFSWKSKSPILTAWSTPGAVLLVTGADGFTMNEAVGAFVVSALLIVICGVTGWFEKIMSRISLSLTSALLAGVLLHFCLDVFSSFQKSPAVIGLMFVAYLVGKRFFSTMTMLFVLSVGIAASMYLELFKFNELQFSFTQFVATAPHFSFAAIMSLAVPLFIVTMASQNLTGYSLMKAYRFDHRISPLITGMGVMSLITSFFGGFIINLAAITAAIAMGPESHPQKEKRYIAALVSGVLYIFVGLFAGTVVSVFAAFPKEMITAIAGLALLGAVSTSLEKSFADSSHKEAAFITFIIAASNLSLFGIGSAFWAIVVGILVQHFFNAFKS